jgi:hypothetical protein
MTEIRNNSNFPACGQWEALLADALDGLLRPEDEADFSAHKMICPACASLFEEAKRGRAWLEYLADEPEMPAGLLDRLLAQTGPGQTAGLNIVSEGNLLKMPPAGLAAQKNRIPAWQRPGLMAPLYRFAEPRLLMTAAMAFFSIALTLNLTGVRLENLRLSSLRLSDFRPGMVRSLLERQFTTASTPVIRYYDHLHFVDEVSLQMRDLRRAAQSDSQPGDGGQPQQKNVQPGETQKNPGQQNPAKPNSAPRISPPQQSARPLVNHSNDLFESSLTIQEQPAPFRGSQNEIRERSTSWTA